PPLDNTFRVNSVDYTIPGTSHRIPAGTFFQIPMYSLQRDPEYFPNPDQMDPSRFLPEAIRGRHPFSYLPFGEGPRVCIGLRFGLMQAKIGLVQLLKNYSFLPDPRTLDPMVFDPVSITLAPKGGMFLKIEKINV
ncbi:probable cytochrome P450 6a14, partial [Uranotaenia lowii]|uniref:probable cytochrome P450 6a14 n=1 Tax=Uranotaenia lowii TaxID=190385 RepID=UPI002479F827